MTSKGNYDTIKKEGGDVINMTNGDFNFTLRLNKNLHKKICIESQKLGISRSGLIRMILNKEFSKKSYGGESE